MAGNSSMTTEHKSRDPEEKTYVGKVQPLEDTDDCYIIVPGELEGGFARVEVFGSWSPPLFADVEIEREVIIERENGEEIRGEVIEYEETSSDTVLEASFVVDTGHDFYKVSARRKLDENEWGDAYELEKAVSGDEARDEVDEVITLTLSGEGSEMWAPVGSVDGIAVMQAVPAS